MSDGSRFGHEPRQQSQSSRICLFCRLWRLDRHPDAGRSQTQNDADPGRRPPTKRTKQPTRSTQHGGMEADADGQPINDHQDTDGDCLSHQKMPLNNNDVTTVFLIDTSEVGTGHDDADQAVEVDEVYISFFLSFLFYQVVKIYVNDESIHVSLSRV